VAGRLSLIDRFLPVWIFLTMAVGVGAGYFFPEIASVFDVLRIDTVSLPIAIGLLWMMYPVLTRVKYEELSKVATAWKMFSLSIVLNWLIGPAIMFGVRAGLALPGRFPGVPGRADHHRPGPLHRHGAHLEPAGPR
jgi:ACR3 family arsenite transporter